MIVTGCSSQVDSRGREMIEHGTAQFPIACYKDRLTVDTVPWHWHEEWEAAVIIRGTAAFFADGNRYVLQEGQGIFVNSMVLHSVRDAADTDCMLRSVVFHPRIVGGSMESVFWQNYVGPVQSHGDLKSVLLDPATPWQKSAIECVEAAWNASVKEEPGYELEARSALSRLAFLLVSRCPSSSAPPAKSALRKSERIKVMLQFVQDHFQEDLTAARIAQSASISESECLRCFRDMVGISPIQYVRQFRLSHAAKLLKTTDLKIAEIGSLCGFQETSYFAKSFREAKGCTPKEYRQKEYRQKP